MSYSLYRILDTFPFLDLHAWIHTHKDVFVLYTCMLNLLKTVKKIKREKGSEIYPDKRGETFVWFVQADVTKRNRYALNLFNYLFNAYQH